MSTQAQFPTPAYNELSQQRQRAVAELYTSGFTCLDEAFRTITETARRVLRVSRTGIWLFTDDATSIYCAYECDNRPGKQRWHPDCSGGELLHLSQNEPYLLKLRESSATVFEPLNENQASPELRRYLRVLGIRSLLDVPLRIDGDLVGILCHEDRHQRAWSNQDHSLATRLGDIAALTIASNRHQQTTASAGKFRTLIEQTPDNIAFCNGNGYFEYLNASARRQLGLAPDEPVHRLRLADYLGPDSTGRSIRSVLRHARNNGAWTGELSLRNRRGDAFVTRFSITTFCGTNGGTEHTSYVIRNISAHTTLKRQLMDATVQYESILAQTGDAIFQVDGATGQIQRVNHALTQMLGYSATRLNNITLFDLVNDTPENIRNYIDTVLEEGHVLLEHRQYRHCDGHWVDVEIAASAIPGEGWPTLSVKARDISERLQRQRDIERLAYYDPLTGLANSNLLRERGEALLAATRPANVTPISYIITEIDNWQRLADRLGYEATEVLLTQMANRLQCLMANKSVLVARLPVGVEFGLLFKTENQDARSLSDDIQKAFDAPVEVNGEPVHLVIRSGIAFFPEHAVNFKDLTMRAGLALRNAHLKNTSYYVYDPTQSWRLHDEHLLEEDLRQAIGTSQIQLRYQPIVNPMSQLIGMEALVRWEHPREGLLKPNDFIAFAEETGLIVELDYDVMSKAICAVSSWFGQKQDITLGINCSSLTLLHPGFVDFVCEAIDHSQLVPTQLRIEVTETALMQDRQTARRVLNQISDLGIQTALDDFGTGYSSLAYLKDLPINTIKIDRAFVRGIGMDVRDERAIETIITLAHDLNMRIIAEGVETSAQNTWLIARGINGMQGYYFGKPQALSTLHQSKYLPAEAD